LALLNTIKNKTMPNTIAGYYTDELVDWNKTIHYHYQEITELETRLAEVIRRNSIVGIAEKVELQQTRLNHISQVFYNLESDMELQEAALRTDSTLIDNEKVDDEIERRQIALRKKIQAAEKEFIDMKFDCYNFLSGTLKKKKDE
jgi:hypothetical protein